MVTCVHYVTATITLTSSVDGRQAACPGEMVTFTCSVIQGVILEWVAEPFIPSLRFPSFSSENTVLDCTNSFVVSCSDFDYQANLTDVDNVGGGFADLTSTFRFTANAMVNVECRTANSYGLQMLNETLNVADPPSPPRNPSYTVQLYGQNDVTLSVQWQPAVYDGGAPVENYTITVAPGGSTFTIPGTNISLTLSYNAMHTVSTVATNCNGSSSDVMLTIRIVNCSDPAIPGNGSIEPYQNTTEGAEIFFSCNSQFVPSTRMMATCGANRMWDPDPSTLVCTFDCGPPPVPRNGSLESYTDATEGSVVFYSCGPGLVPERRMMSVCIGTGWNPNPGALSCSAVNCGMPTGPRNGSIEPYRSTLGGAEIIFMCDSTFIYGTSTVDCGDPTTASSEVIVQYNSTRVNSVIFYQCRQSGFAPSSSSAMCMENGRWSPDPSQVVCRMVTTIMPTVDCGVPTTTGNGSIETYQDRTEGAEVFFKCNPGFVPAGRMRAVCTAHGRWNPDPAGLECTASTIVCVAPSFASGIAVEPFSSTTVSSEVLYQCQPGLSLEARMTSVCGEDGRWNPDPAGVTCTTVTISAAAAIAITAIVCTLIAFIAGVLCCAVVTVCISRWNKKGPSSKSTSSMQEQQQTVPVYEEVDTQSQKIELKENVAYGPVKVL